MVHNRRWADTIVMRGAIIAGTLGAAIAFAPDAVAGEQQGAVCWSPSQLTVRRGDNRIVKDIRAAYRPRPVGDAAASPRPVPYGAIRRVNLPGNAKIIALTFDLCEQPHEISGYQGDIVDYLRSERLPATFFATGKWLLTHSERGQQLMADPLFEIGNHGWSHRNFRILTGSALVGELTGSQAAYRRTRKRLQARQCRVPGLSGPAYRHVPRRQTLMRFPFGACSPAALRAVQDQKLLAIQWDVSSADPWKGQTADAMVEHVVRRTRSGSILLFHANGRGWRTPDALPVIVAKLRAKGFKFATVSELLSMPGARPEIVSRCYDSKPGDSERYDGLARRLEQRYAAFRRRFGFPPDDKEQ